MNKRFAILIALSLGLAFGLMACATTTTTSCGGCGVTVTSTETTTATSSTTTTTSSVGTTQTVYTTTSDETTTTTTTSEETTTTTTTEETEPFTVTFVLDEHVTVTVCPTQEYANGEVTTLAYAKDGDTGEILTDGEGQVNFLITVEEGYELVNVLGTPSANYTNLKGPDETLVTDAYRVTKIVGDVTVTITTQEEGSGGEVEGFLATFVLDEHVTVTVYTTQAYDDGIVATTAYARDSATGEILIDGNGQINFLVTVDEGYTLGSITITPANYKNLKGEADTGVANLYRITKITGDITVTITVTPAN